MKTRLDEKRAELRATVAYGEEIATKATETTDDSALAEYREEMTATETKADALRNEIHGLEKDEARATRIKSIGSDIFGQNANESDDDTEVQYRDVVEKMLHSDEFKAAREDSKAGRQFGRFEIEWKAPGDPPVYTTSTPLTDNPDATLVQHVRSGVVAPVVRSPRVGQLFAQSGMDGASVQWLNVATETAGGDFVAYPGAAPAAGTATMTISTQRAQTVAAKYLAPVEALDDLSALDGVLRKMLLTGSTGIEVIAEYEYVNGDNVTEPYGVLTLSPSAVTGNGRLSKDIIAAALEIEGDSAAGGAGAPADAVVLNPADYSKLIFEEGADERPLGSAFGGGYGIIDMGMQIVRSNAVASGTAIVGAFQESILFTRRSASITVDTAGVGLRDAGLALFVATARVALTHPRGATAFRTVDTTIY